MQLKDCSEHAQSLSENYSLDSNGRLPGFVKANTSPLCDTRAPFIAETQPPPSFVLQDLTMAKLGLSN